jgi:hypothetical protein
MMRVRVVPYGELKRLLQTREQALWLDLSEGATVGDALRLLGINAQEVVGQDAEGGRLIVGLDGEYATEETPLRPNAELTLVTQMMGG